MNCSTIDEVDSLAGNEGQGCSQAQVLPEARTILLVEDEMFVREVASEVLRAAGYRVLTAKNAAEAVQIYAQADCDVDLLLTDVILPGENGRALAEELRHENPLLPVLLATGYGEQMIRETAYECLPKPFASDALLRRVGELMKARPRRAAVMSGRLTSLAGLQDQGWNLV